MDKKIEEFVQARRLAVVGVSRNKQKFGSAIYTELKQRGFEVYGVNPQMDQIEGDPCYHDLASLAGKVDGVVICVSPQQTASVVRDAAAAGITKIWIQQGAQSVESGKAAKDAGVDPVTGKCILMYAGEANSIHGFHKFVSKVFGQY
jgi:predicted CoA-binding protein